MNTRTRAPEPSDATTEHPVASGARLGCRRVWRRWVRDHGRAVQTAVAELDATLRRTPTDTEVAEHKASTSAASTTSSVRCR